MAVFNAQVLHSFEPLEKTGDKNVLPRRMVCQIKFPTERWLATILDYLQRLVIKQQLTESEGEEQPQSTQGANPSAFGEETFELQPWLLFMLT